MAYYGLASDVQANPDKNILLFTPGKTKLTAQDVFLGGPGTGVTDDMIGPATRAYGQTAAGTRKALEHYESDLGSQTKAAIAQNDAPRADAYRGRPTMARMLMEQDQVKSAVNNNLTQKSYEENLRQAALNETWKQKNFDYGKEQDAIDNDYRMAALNASSAKASAPKAMTAAQIKAANLSEAYADIQKALDSGASPDVVKQSILSRSGDYALMSITPDTLTGFVDDIVKSWGKYDDDTVKENPAITESKAMSAWNTLQNMWNK